MNGPWLSESAIRSTLEDDIAPEEGRSEEDIVENGVEVNQRKYHIRITAYMMLMKEV